MDTASITAHGHPQLAAALRAIGHRRGGPARRPLSPRRQLQLARAARQDAALDRARRPHGLDDASRLRAA